MGNGTLVEDAQSDQSLDLAAGRFGRYQLLFRLATGGMAELYVGRLGGVQGFEKLVIIKLIHREHAENSSFVKMFIDEARLVAQITHPNVVQVIELGQIEGSYYIAMEYIHGESLEALCSKIQLPLPLCVRIIADAAAGLHAAHDLCSTEGKPLHVVHRDVSPSNILLGYDGVVKVTDFGVARARSNLHKTQVGVLKGKYAYMAPEYIERETVDHRSDIFALGVLLYEITTNQRLFKASSENLTMRKVLEGTIIPPTLIVKDYPEDLEHIVLTSLNRDPSLRYPTAQEMHNALEQYIVDSGQPALNSEIGELMRTTFSERIQRKRELLQLGQPSVTLPEIQEEPSVPSASPTYRGRSTSRMEQAPDPKRRQQIIVLSLSGTLLSVAIIALAIFLLLPDPLPETPETQSATDPKKPTKNVRTKTRTKTKVRLKKKTKRQASPTKPLEIPKISKSREIEIKIQVSPADAKLKLDGKLVSNPYQRRQKAGKGELVFTAEASGYEGRSITVSLDQGGDWKVALAKASTTQQARRPPLNRRQPKTTKKKRRVPKQTRSKTAKKTARKKIESKTPTTKRKKDDLFGSPFGN